MDELKVQFTLSQGKRSQAFRFSFRAILIALDIVKCLARQLLEGLEYLHRNDIIHRHVAPIVLLKYTF